MSTSLTGWFRDLALAYAGGLVLGAPIALVATWWSGLERLSTVCLLLTMVAVLIGARRRTGAASSACGGAGCAGTSPGLTGGVPANGAKGRLSEAA